MRVVGTVAFLFVLLSGPVASADDYRMSPERLIHRSVAVVTSIERDAGFLVIRQDDGQVLRIYVDRTSAGDSVEPCSLPISPARSVQRVARVSGSPGGIS